MHVAWTSICNTNIVVLDWQQQICGYEVWILLPASSHTHASFSGKYTFPHV